MKINRSYKNLAAMLVAIMLITPSLAYAGDTKIAGSAAAAHVRLDGVASSLTKLEADLRQAIKDGDDATEGRLRVLIISLKAKAKAARRAVTKAKTATKVEAEAKRKAQTDVMKMADRASTAETSLSMAQRNLLSMRNELGKTELKLAVAKSGKDKLEIVKDSLLGKEAHILGGKLFKLPPVSNPQQSQNAARRAAANDDKRSQQVVQEQKSAWDSCISSGGEPSSKVITDNGVTYTRVQCKRPLHMSMSLTKADSERSSCGTTCKVLLVTGAVAVVAGGIVGGYFIHKAATDDAMGNVPDININAGSRSAALVSF